MMNLDLNLPTHPWHHQTSNPERSLRKNPAQKPESKMQNFMFNWSPSHTASTTLIYISRQFLSYRLPSIYVVFVALPLHTVNCIKIRFLVVLNVVLVICLITTCLIVNLKCFSGKCFMCYCVPRLINWSIFVCFCSLVTALPNTLVVYKHYFSSVIKAHLGI